MKTCTKCQSQKELTEFVKDKRRSDGCGSWCLECNRAYAKTLYQRPDQKASKQAYHEANKAQINHSCRERWAKNKDRYRVAGDKWREANRDHLLSDYARRGSEHRVLTDSLKSGPCQDCGKTFPPFCMEFDHVVDEKRFAVGKMSNHRRAAVLEEVAKCELVCCNCHRVRTHLRRGGSSLPKVVSFRKWINELKAHPCYDCGLTFHHAAMDFDHVRDPKLSAIGGISDMWSWGRDKVLAEITKCDLVCANCHRVRTHQSLKPLRVEAQRPLSSMESSDAFR